MKQVVQTQRGCCICNEFDAKKLYELKLSLFQNMPLPDEYKIVCCQKCGFVYHDSSAKFADYERYYQEFNKYGHSSTILNETLELFHYYKNVINHVIAKDAFILDIGCASGILLGLLREEGYSNVAGIDPSIECVQSMKSKGIDAYCGSIYTEIPEVPKKSFDLIILSGVMEHLFNIKGAIEVLDKYLKEDGKIFIGVPDASMYGDFYNAISYYFNIEHINHFSNISLDNLLMQFKYGNISTHYHTIHFGSCDIPVFSAVYRRDVSVCDSQKKDIVTFQSVEKYFQLYNQVQQDNQLMINNLCATQEELIIWGGHNGSITSK